MTVTNTGSRIQNGPVRRLRRATQAAIALGAAAAAVMLGPAPAATAQEVRLTSTDGLISLTGRLVSHENGQYVIEGRLGTIAVPADQVMCEGEGCLAPTEVTTRMRVLGEPELLRAALPEFLDAYSLAVDTDISRDETDDGKPIYRLLSFEGETVVDAMLVPADAAATFKALASGEAALGVVGRQITAAEVAAMGGEDIAALKDLGLERIIGYDGIVAVVGSEVPIRTLTLEQLALIYSGRITNWSALGGPDMPISTFTREPGSSVRALLNEMVMTPAGLAVGENVITVDSNGGVVRAVETFRNGIGVTSVTELSGLRTVAIPDQCGRPISPSVASVKTGIYPLSKPVYLYGTPGDLPIHARGLMDFAVTSIGQQVLRATGYVDMLPERATVAAPEGSDALIEGASRLTTTFHALDGRAPLDIHGLNALAILAEHIRSANGRNNEYVLVGLSEDLGAARVAARRLLRVLFTEHPDIEEQLDVAFRIGGAGPEYFGECAAANPGDRTVVQVWQRPLAGG